MKDLYRGVTAIGLDVHYKFTQVCMRDKDANVLRKERLRHDVGRVALRARLATWPKGVPVVMEGSYGWGWLAEEMVALGLQVNLSNCFKVKRWAASRTDRHSNEVDAGIQSELPFEKRPWWKVWMPPPDVRDDRSLVRYRQDLVDLNVQVRNRIHAVMHEYGIFYDFTDLFGSKGRAFLKQLCREGRTEEVQLRPGILEALRGNLRVWEALRKELAAVERTLRASLKHNELTRRLDTLPGVGLVLSHVIASEIGDIRRFRSQAALSNYAMLVPRENTTGERDRTTPPPSGQHVGKRGNRRLKWALVEAAHGARRSSPRLARIYASCTRGGRQRRQQGVIRIAHELARLVYLLWTRGEPFQECPAAARARKSSRPSRRQRMIQMLKTRSVREPSPAMAAVRNRQASR